MPHVLGTNAGGDPEDNEVVEKIGAFAHDRFAIAAGGVENHLDRFLGELFRHFGATGAQQSGRPRFLGIGILSIDDGGVEAIERISHKAEHRPALARGKLRWRTQYLRISNYA